MLLDGVELLLHRCPRAMRILQSILFAILSFASLCRGDPTNTFAIYLTAGPVESRILRQGTQDLSNLKLQAIPLISETDVLVYDLTKHWLTLKPEVFSRLPRPSIPGTPFLVIANGERVYLGAFTTPASSIPVLIPSIISMGRQWYTNLPPDTLQIDRGYPGPRNNTDPDPRGDERIKRALAALHKLK
jgi:hypothetical protein